MMLRLSRGDTFIAALRKLITHTKNGQKHLDLRACKIVIQSIRAAQHFSNKYSDDREIDKRLFIRSMLDRYDWLGLHANMIGRFYRQVAGSNDAAMMAYMVAQEHGLTAEDVKAAWNKKEEQLETLKLWPNKIYALVREDRLHEYKRFLPQGEIEKPTRPHGRPKGVAGRSPRRLKPN